MLKRVLGIVVVAAALTALLVASQRFGGRAKVSGFIEADEIRLGSRVGGRVAKVLAQEGDRVDAGQELVRLEPYDLTYLKQQAEAELAARQAELEKLRAGNRPEEIAEAEAKYRQLSARLELLRNGPRPQEIDAARRRVTIAEAALQFAENNFERVKRLVDTRAVAVEEFDDAQEKLTAAQATLQVRNSELEVLELGSRTEEIAEAEAKVAEAEAAWQLSKQGFRQEEIDAAAAARDAAAAALAAAQERLDELAIRSPIAAEVESLDLRPGDLVAPSGPVLALVDFSRLWVRAYVPSNRTALEVGDELQVAVDAFPDEQFRGEVIYISPQAEFTPSNVQTPDERAKLVFRIKVLLREGLGKLRPGMSADVWLDPAASAGAAP